MYPVFIAPLPKVLYFAILWLYFVLLGVPMGVDLFSVGFSNYVSAARLVAIANPSSAPVKRMVRQAEEKGLIIDLTAGRKVKAVLVLDSGHVALVARQTDTVAGRVNAAATKSLPEPEFQESDHD